MQKHERGVEKIAEQLQKQGFAVVKNPVLQSKYSGLIFRPDIIAKRGEKNLIIEVKEEVDAHDILRTDSMIERAEIGISTEGLIVRIPEKSIFTRARDAIQRRIAIAPQRVPAKQVPAKHIEVIEESQLQQYIQQFK